VFKVHFFRISLNQLNLLQLHFVRIDLFILTFSFICFFFFSIVSGFKQSHTSRAVCCRLEKATDPVRVHHPMIGKMKQYFALRLSIIVIY